MGRGLWWNQDGSDIHVSQVLRHNEPVIAYKGSPRSTDAGFAVGGEGELGGAGVAAVEGPFGLTVADYEDARGGHRLV